MQREKIKVTEQVFHQFGIESGGRTHLASMGIYLFNWDALADYFDSCRSKRNITDYDFVGTISDSEVEELIQESESFLEVVLDWLKKNYKIY